ncbi:hypothetical protein BEP19_13460 [Ammoniphilus oxalaticus]|uniref:Superoxide dismutase copper/zinc binding domain-containing protein n=1 Tax=Ammoniphilus oxalaticus TaxID=66863 RepID=A0A419SF28_9BACL|nr:superoxide dismutase family protein [Ammoniphilus oxalaticus]RKD22073.1 hypothetical protein BEP19_13460 [Ammoniphilus oxalaticus]
MKRFVSGVILGTFLTSGAAFAAVKGDISSMKILLSGQEKMTSYGGPVVIDGRTYLPLRDVSGWFNRPVYWNEQTRTVSIDQPLVTLIDSNGKEIGAILLKQEAGGVNLTLEAVGLTPGKHGFHIHASSFTGTDFSEAGGHFNPDGAKHGYNHRDHEGDAHLGDLGNIEVAVDGSVKTEIFVPRATLEKGHPNSILGKSFIIHAEEDDLTTDPAGNAGDRVAGGNIPE